VLPALALYAVFVLWPLAWLIGCSLMQWDGYSAPLFLGLANYGTLWADPTFRPELWHSLLWLGVTLVVPVVLGFALALLLASTPARLRAILRALLLISLLLPTTVIAVVWRLLYNPLAGPITGVLNAVNLGALAGDWLGDPSLALDALLVAACWAAFGLSMLVFEAALGAIASELVDAAQIDGAGAWARFHTITVPSVRGAAPVAMVATALCAVPSVDLVRLLTNGGPGYTTTTLALDMYGRAFNTGQVGVGAALACLQIVVGLFLAGAALALAPRGERMSAEGDGLRPSQATCRGATHVVAGTMLAAVTMLMVFPLVWLVVLAVRSVAQTGGTSLPAALWGEVGTVWSNGFGAAFLFSLSIAVPVAAGVVVLALPVAFALFSSRRRAVCVLGAVLLAIGLFQPESVLVIPLFGTLKWLGLLNTPLGLVVPQIARTLPIAVLLLWGALRSVPADVLAAAEVDTAAPRQVLRHVALPLVLPMVVVVGLWAFLSSWNDYLLPLVALQDETLQTVPLALAHFMGSVDTQYGLLATGALLAIAPILALYGPLYGVGALGVRRLRALRGRVEKA
jgi:raffinose/stachyose/melibiose transport system permease protein